MSSFLSREEEQKFTQKLVISFSGRQFDFIFSMCQICCSAIFSLWMWSKWTFEQCNCLFHQNPYLWKSKDVFWITFYIIHIIESVHIEVRGNIVPQWSKKYLVVVHYILLLSSPPYYVYICISVPGGSHPSIFNFCKVLISCSVMVVPWRQQVQLDFWLNVRLFY